MKNFKYVTVLFLLLTSIWWAWYYNPLRNAKKFLVEFHKELGKSGSELVYSDSSCTIDIANPWRYGLPDVRIYVNKNEVFSRFNNKDIEFPISNYAVLNYCVLDLTSHEYQTYQQTIVFNTINHAKNDTVYYEVFDLGQDNKIGGALLAMGTEFKYVREYWLTKNSEGQYITCKRGNSKDKEQVTRSWSHPFQFLLDRVK